MRQLPRILLGIEDSRDYGRGLLRGISKYARVHGPWLFSTRPDFYNSCNTQGGRPTDLWQARFSGVITRELEPRAMKRIFSLGVPVIVANHISLQSGHPSIMTDCKTIGELAARHFLDRGFRHFGYCGLSKMFWSVRREVSFQNVLNSAGFSIHIYHEPRAKQDRQWSREQVIMAQWLQQLPRPIAIMACTDDRARYLLEACEIAELNVPEDVAILGVDNDPLVCDLAGVPLSSIALNSESAGYDAAALLDRLMNGESVQNESIIVSATHVETRRSTDILAMDDRLVAQAVHFINTRAHQPLDVPQVAREVGVNERQLFDRFQLALGRSVHDQINHARIDRICWLLENTAMPILEIALSMGMTDDKHLSRFFRKHRDCSPLEWRARTQQTSTSRLIPHLPPVNSSHHHPKRKS